MLLIHQVTWNRLSRRLKHKSQTLLRHSPEHLAIGKPHKLKDQNHKLFLLFHELIHRETSQAPISEPEIHLIPSTWPKGNLTSSNIRTRNWPHSQHLAIWKPHKLQYQNQKFASFTAPGQKETSQAQISEQEICLIPSTWAKGNLTSSNIRTRNLSHTQHLAIGKP